MRKFLTGFTLAELLIALSILGVIATFTIPKVLQSQQSGEYNAKAKEVIGMISGAYQAYKQGATASGSTSTSHLTPFMNYVAVDTASLIDREYAGSSRNCANPTDAFMCLKLHNGGTLMVYNSSFNNTANTNSIWFLFDPDGKYGGTTNGPGKGLNIVQYYNGRLATESTIAANTCDSTGCYGPTATADPPWFSWN